MISSETLFDRALKVSPGGVHSPVRAFKSVGGTPVFFKSARGAYMKSVEGADYIDYCQSFGPLILGHRDPDVMTAVKSAIDTAWSFGACEPYSLELAEYMVDTIPHLEKVRFVSSGTEAVMSVLRLAKAATGRNKILKFSGCYHGHVDSMLVKAGSGLAGIGASDSAGVSASVAAETLVAPLGDQLAVEKIFAEHGHDIAGVAVEPLPANFGLLVQSQQFLEFLRDITRRHKALLIFDEVISGFRVALGGMTEVTGIVPDLSTYGKIIGGGFPVGCYGGPAALMELVAPAGPVYQAGTLSGNPVGMIAGLATLKKLREKNIIPKLNEFTASFVQELRDLFANESVPWQVVHRGSIFWLHTATTAEPSHLGELPADLGEKYKKFFHACLEENIYFAPSGYEVSFMSWAHNEKVIVDTILGIKSALKKLKGVF